MRRDRDLMDVQPWARTNEPGFSGQQRGAQESCGENILDGLGVQRRIEQVRGPSRQNAGNAIVICFGDEIVPARVSLKEQSIERRLLAIAGVQVKLAID